MNGTTTSRHAPFTRTEILHGAFVAWITFLTLLTVALAIATVVSALSASDVPRSLAANAAVLPVALMAGLGIGGPVSGGVTLLMLPVAERLARHLAHTASARIQVSVYALLGATIGLVASGIAFVGFHAPPQAVAGYWWFPASTVVICAAATAHGWWRVLHRRTRRLSGN